MGCGVAGVSRSLRYTCANATCAQREGPEWGKREGGEDRDGDRKENRKEGRGGR